MRNQLSALQTEPNFFVEQLRGQEDANAVAAAQLLQRQKQNEKEKEKRSLSFQPQTRGSDGDELVSTAFATVIIAKAAHIQERVTSVFEDHRSDVETKGDTVADEGSSICSRWSTTASTTSSVSTRVE